MLKVLSVIVLIIVLILSNDVQMNVDQIFVLVCAIIVALGTTYLIKTSN